MKIQHVINIEDLHRQAKRHVPRVAFDYFEGGVEDERGLARNEAAFQRYRLLPRYLVDVSQVDQSATLFGRTYASPFGVAPFGVAGLLRARADLMLAEAAAAANIPYTLSGFTTGALEEAAQVAPEHAWFQLYGARDRAISEDQIRRAADAGMPALMFTVDVPVVSNRERERRNRFGQKPMPLWAYLEALRHPAWLLGYLRRGRPLFRTWQRYAGGGHSADEVIRFVATQFPVADHTWHDVERFRRLWPRTFILKGILHADDARRAAELGVDGIVVSNHGARQLDAAPSPLEVLPAIRAAVGERLAVLMDSGFRRGSDIVIARCLGADFVFLGRAMAFGVAAYGLPGARLAIALLQREIEMVLKQIGCPRQDQLGPEFLLRVD
jgi:isopentenyl diphosphate isomerase/L-lactate dehydrogenase-like FMN-dependent dehydrogenase